MRRRARGSRKGRAVLLIDNFLDADTAARLRKKILETPFVSGGATATGRAAKVKNNLQMDRERGRKILDDIALRLMTHEQVELYAIPKRIAAMSVNRYDVGMEYGSHTDAPIMNDCRCDLSFTLFLEDHVNYDGGELTLEQEHGLLKVKPAIGSLFLYSTGLIHCVTPVTRGSRLACIGWIQSRVRDERQRTALRELNIVHRAYLERHGHDELHDMLLKNSANLMRMWCD
jgi:PKHD-type hydroxylase